MLQWILTIKFVLYNYKTVIQCQTSLYSMFSSYISNQLIGITIEVACLCSIQ